VTRCAAWLALGLMLLPVPGKAQPADPRSRLGGISGQVVSAQTGAPLANATVHLSSMAVPGRALEKTTVADENGAFDFPDLPAGDYSVWSSRPGYQLAGAGQIRSLGPARRVSVTAGRRVELTLPMHRAGAIVGRVINEFGEPVADVQVRALRWSYDSAGRRAALSAGVGDLTDDLGQFRVYGLPSGDYAVVATGRDPAGLMASFNPVARNDWLPTYYPGTVNLAEAQTVSLGSGDEASVQLAISPGRAVGVIGRAVASNGSPASGTVTIWPRGNSVARRSERVSADGMFSFGGLSPGDYWINVNSRAGGIGEAESIPVSVGSEPVSGLSIVTRAGATIRGTVVFEGTRPRSNFRLSVQQAEGRSGPYGLTELGGFVTAGADGRFEATNLLGRVTFRTMDDGWVVRSVTAGGADVLDAGLELSGKDAVNGIRITVSNRLTRVAGRVADAGGEPLSDHLVILLRLDGLPPDGLGLRAVRTDLTGRFEATKLRPGSYVVGVVEDLEPGYHLSPQFQERLRERGQRFRLGEGAEIALELPLTSGLE